MKNPLSQLQCTICDQRGVLCDHIADFLRAADNGELIDVLKRRHMDDKVKIDQIDPNYVALPPTVYLNWAEIMLNIKQALGMTTDPATWDDYRIRAFAELSCRFLNSLPAGFGVKTK